MVESRPFDAVLIRSSTPEGRAAVERKTPSGHSLKGEEAIMWSFPGIEMCECLKCRCFTVYKSLNVYNLVLEDLFDWRV